MPKIFDEEVLLSILKKDQVAEIVLSDEPKLLGVIDGVANAGSLLSVAGGVNVTLTHQDTSDIGAPLRGCLVGVEQTWRDSFPRHLAEFSSKTNI